MRKTYVYDPVLKKCVEKSEYLRTHTYAVHVFKPFTSPIDGSEIRDSAQLSVHNRKHGVTDQRDYGPDWFEREGRKRDDRLTGSTKKDKQNRIDTINRAMREQGL